VYKTVKWNANKTLIVARTTQSVLYRHELRLPPITQISKPYNTSPTLVALIKRCLIKEGKIC